MAISQNLVPLVNIKIAGKWMFIPLKMVSIGIDPYPYRSYVMVTQKQIQLMECQADNDNDDTMQYDALTF